jgi:two-component system cell cycle sensor histidine kinase/response regulator CckA
LQYTLAEARKYFLILLVGVALILTAEFLGFFAGMDNHCYDLFFRLRGPVEPDNRILIAAVDENTLNRLGRWPLRRSHYARLLNRLDKAQIVGLDILMIEPSEDDTILAGAIRKHGRVVLPTYIVKPLQVADTVSSLSPRRVGHIHLEQEVDGVVRKVYHTLYAGGRQLPSFASAIHETLTGKLFPREPPAGNGRDRTTQARIIQMDASRINYYGPPGTFPRLSLIDIIDGRYPDDFFTDRIVLVGVTAAGLEAGVLTPFTQHRDQMHGVETHAHILGNLIDRNSLSDVTDPIRWGVSLGFAFLGLLLFLRNEGWQAALLWFIGIVAVSAASYAVFSLANLWFSPILLYGFFSFMFVVAYIYRLEQSGRQLGEARDAWEESFNTINDAIVLMDMSGTAVRMNAAAKTLLEPHMLNLLSRKCFLLKEALAPASGETQSDPASAAGEGGGEEIPDPFADRHYEVKSLSRFDPMRRLIGFVHVVRDITLRKKTEAERERLQFQLLQSQKMQSIGRLAGGVAHDFNNILTAILGYSELALLKLSDGDPLRDSIRVIRDSGLKASALTRQLLAFSRKQVMELQVVNLRDIVGDMAKILTRIIGEDVMLRLQTEKPLRNILADPVHMEQVLLNLSVNARDAMPRGGTVTIETADVELDETYTSRREGVTPGSYVMLAVTDTGEGMSPEVQTRIFEPFFTTKKIGEGTGLGLSTVYGIVKQMSGHIDVFSEQGKGSVFTVYLPVCREDAEAAAQAEAFGMPRGTETVLIAEDDDAIRKLLADILDPLGYRVITARSGAEALRLAETTGRGVDILLTDVVMPGMSGKELAQMFQAIDPGIKVLFMSGYTEEVIIRHGVERTGVAFIQKPLIPNKLVRKLREVLDGK